MATVSETVSKPASVSTIRHYLPVFAETRQNSRSQTRLKPDWFLDQRNQSMKSRFILFRRAGVFYSEDTTTGKQHSLRTKDEAEALTLLHSKNEAHRQPVLNLQIARTYLTATDPEVANRKWQTAMDELTKTKSDTTRHRHVTAMKDKAFDIIRNLPILETRSAHFLKVLELGTVSTNVYLRRIHNFALDMNWLPWSILPKRQWPKVKFKEKRAITLEEHQRIIAAEVNPERKTLYQLCWHLGASQGDIASLKGEDVDWTNGTVEIHPQEVRRAGAGAFGRGGFERVQRPARRRRAVSVSVPRAGWRPGHGVWATVPPTWHHRHHVAQLPLRMGGTRQDLRLPGTVRPGGFGAQQQGRASRLRETRPDENPVTGRLREETGRRGHSAGEGELMERCFCRSA
jgi:integrase